MKTAEDVRIRNLISTVVVVVICFLLSTVLIFYIFSQSLVDPRTSAVLGLICGAFVAFIIMALNGSLKEFSVKSPLFEMTSVLKERIQYVQDDLVESKKEIKEKIASLENKINITTNNQMTANPNQVANFDFRGIFREAKEIIKTENDMMATKLSSAGIGIDNLPSINQELPGNVREELDAYKQRIKKMEVLIQKLPVTPEFDIEFDKEKAYTLLVNHKYSQASDLYDKIIQNDPEDVEALVRKGVTLYYLGKHSESIPYFDRALKIEPDNVLALHRRGSAIWYTKKDMDAADEYYDRALKINPNFIFSLWTKACNQSWRQKKDEALKYLEKVIRLDSRYKKFARREPAFEFMRDDPIFVKLTKND